MLVAWLALFLVVLAHTAEGRKLAGHGHGQQHLRSKAPHALTPRFASHGQSVSTPDALSTNILVAAPAQAAVNVHVSNIKLEALAVRELQVEVGRASLHNPDSSLVRLGINNLELALSLNVGIDTKPEWLAAGAGIASNPLEAEFNAQTAATRETDPDAPDVSYVYKLRVPNKEMQQHKMFRLAAIKAGLTAELDSISHAFYATPAPALAEGELPYQLDECVGGQGAKTCIKDLKPMDGQDAYFTLNEASFNALKPCPDSETSSSGCPGELLEIPEENHEPSAEQMQKLNEAILAAAKAYDNRVALATSKWTSGGLFAGGVAIAGGAAVFATGGAPLVLGVLGGLMTSGAGTLLYGAQKALDPSSRFSDPVLRLIVQKLISRYLGKYQAPIKGYILGGIAKLGDAVPDEKLAHLKKYTDAHPDFKAELKILSQVYSLGSPEVRNAMPALISMMDTTLQLEPPCVTTVTQKLIEAQVKDTQHRDALSVMGLIPVPPKAAGTIQNVFVQLQAIELVELQLPGGGLKIRIDRSGVRLKLQNLRVELQMKLRFYGNNKQGYDDAQAQLEKAAAVEFREVSLPADFGGDADGSTVVQEAVDSVKQASLVGATKGALLNIGRGLGKMTGIGCAGKSSGEKEEDRCSTCLKDTACVYKFLDGCHEKDSSSKSSVFALRKEQCTDGVLYKEAVHKANEKIMNKDNGFVSAMKWVGQGLLDVTAGTVGDVVKVAEGVAEGAVSAVRGDYSLIHYSGPIHIEISQLNLDMHAVPTEDPETKEWSLDVKAEQKTDPESAWGDTWWTDASTASKVVTSTGFKINDQAMLDSLVKGGGANVLMDSIMRYYFDPSRYWDKNAGYAKKLYELVKMAGTSPTDSAGGDADPFSLEVQFGMQGFHVNAKTFEEIPQLLNTIKKAVAKSTAGTAFQEMSTEATETTTEAEVECSEAAVEAPQRETAQRRKAPHGKP